MLGSVGIVVGFRLFHHDGLTLTPETESFDDLVLLSDVQVLVFEKQLEVLLREVLDIRVMDQVSEVLADIGEYLAM